MSPPATLTPDLPPCGIPATTARRRRLGALLAVSVASVTCLLACQTEQQGTELSERECKTLLRKLEDLDQDQGSSLDAMNRRTKKVRMDRCLREGTRRMYDCVTLAQSTGELRDCGWRGM